MIARLTGWRYDATHPYDDAARRELRACADEIVVAHAQVGDARNEVEGTLARNFATQLAITEAQGADSARAIGLRDRAMADNLRWHRKRLGADVRVVVWSATIHTGKRSPGSAAGATRMGEILHAELGESYAAIGFTAAAGSHARPGMSPQAITASAPGSLERRVLGDAASGLGYADREALHALGTVAGHALSYGRLETIDWSQVLAGLVVFAEERPPRPVRAARPSAR